MNQLGHDIVKDSVTCYDSPLKIQLSVDRNQGHLIDLVIHSDECRYAVICNTFESLESLKQFSSMCGIGEINYLITTALHKLGLK